MYGHLHYAVHSQESEVSDMTDFQRLARLDMQNPRAVSAAIKISRQDNDAHTNVIRLTENLLFVRWLVSTGRLNDNA